MEKVLVLEPLKSPVGLSFREDKTLENSHGKVHLNDIRVD
jgi:hypothetical protein